MSNKVLLLENGTPVTTEGTANGQVLTWDNDTGTAAFAAGGSGSGTVTSVGLTGGTSGLIIGGASSPVTTSGTYNINSPQRFQFDTSADFAPTAVGQMSWNAVEGSLNTLMVGGNVDAVVGQQLYQRAVNGDTVTLTKGTVVYVFGSSGTRVQVKRAIADADLTSATILGVVAESIAVNGEGFIITNGKLGAVNVLPSTTFADGDVVYLSPTTAGGLTPTKPVAPQHLVMVGYCVKASNGSAGVLMVHPQNGYELSELHDVYINSPTSGQILVYDATTGQTRWENTTLGGTNGVAVTTGAGTLSVGLNSASSPTLTGLTLSGLTNGLVRSTTGVLAGGATVVGSDFGSQTANYVFAAPNGSTGNPSFRALTTSDISGFSSGAVTSVAGTANQVLVNGGTVAAAGAVTLTLPQDIGTGSTPTFNSLILSGALGLPAAQGGTGNKSYTAGDMLYASTTTQLSKLTMAASGNVLLSSVTSSSPGWGKVGLTTHVSGTLPLANGGTNANLTAANGQVAYSTASAVALTTGGSTGQFLSYNSGSAPTWADVTVPAQPYDISGEVVGTPTTGATILRFVAARTFTLGGTAQFACTTGPTSTATFTVNVAGVSKGTVTIATSGTSGNGSITSTSVTVGQTVTVVATTPAAIVDVWFTLPGTV